MRKTYLYIRLQFQSFSCTQTIAIKYNLMLPQTQSQSINRKLFLKNFIQSKESHLPSLPCGISADLFERASPLWSPHRKIYEWGWQSGLYLPHWPRATPSSPSNPLPGACSPAALLVWTQGVCHRISSLTSFVKCQTQQIFFIGDQPAHWVEVYLFFWSQTFQWELLIVWFVVQIQKSRRVKREKVPVLCVCCEYLTVTDFRYSCIHRKKNEKCFTCANIFILWEDKRGSQTCLALDMIAPASAWVFHTTRSHYSTEVNESHKLYENTFTVATQCSLTSSLFIHSFIVAVTACCNPPSSFSLLTTATAQLCGLARGFHNRLADTMAALIQVIRCVQPEVFVLVSLFIAEQNILRSNFRWRPVQVLVQTKKRGSVSQVFFSLTHKDEAWLYPDRLVV